MTGFSLAEVDIVLDEARESSTEGAEASAEDAIPAYRHDGPTVAQPGDLWTLGRHKLVCGDARETAAYATLLGDEIVDLICTDPPYNVPIDGHVCGSGRIRHRNFAMGVGEMNRAQFTRFLVDTLTPAAARCRDGAIAFVSMDWRHNRRHGRRQCLIANPIEQNLATCESPLPTDFVEKGLAIGPSL